MCEYGYVYCRDYSKENGKIELRECAPVLRGEACRSNPSPKYRPALDSYCRNSCESCATSDSEERILLGVGIFVGTWRELG